MKRYKLEHEPLTGVMLSTGGGLILISGEPDFVLRELQKVGEQVRKAERRCYDEIDKRVRQEIAKPYIKEIKELTKKLEEK